MSEMNAQLEVPAMADQFIELANRLILENNQEIGRVGAAIRYAAARFNAHEVSFKSEDLERDKDDALSWFTAEFRHMLVANIDEHIAIRKQGRQAEA